MANLLVILAAIWAAVMKAQQVTHLWTVQRGGSGSDRAYALQVDASGNAFVAGYTASTDLGSQSNAGDFDMFVMKLDSLGAHQWTILRGGSSVEEARGLQVDASGNVFVAGYTASTDLDSQSNAGDFDVFVMKFDSDGAHQWTILRGGSGDDFAYGLQVDASGNVFVAGYTASTDLDNQSNAGDFDVFVMKFDSDGAHQWTILRGGPGDEFAYGLQVDASVNVFVAGTMDSQFHPNDTDVFVTKVDRDGAHQWTILRGGSSYDYPQCLQVDASGNVFVAGFTASTDLDSQSNAGNTDVFVMKFDSDGAHQWTILRGGPGDEFAYGLQVDASGNVFVAGYTDSDLDSQSNAGGYDVFVMKLDSLGAHQWTILRGDSGDDFANGLQVDASGNVFVAGETQNSLDGNTNAGSWDITVMKFQVPTTTVTTTSRTLALSTTVTEATTTTTTVAHSSTQTSTTLRMERLLPADTQAMASSSAVMLDQMKLTQQATIDQQQSFDSQTSSGPVFGVKLDAVPDDPVVLRNSNASNTSPLIVSFPAHCDDTGSAAAWLVASEIADALSNRLPTQAVGETVPAEYRSKVVDVSVLKEMQGSISVAEINCGSPIAIRLSASKPSAGDRCLWFDFAQQKWSQAGTEVLEELELRVMYPDTDLPWDGTWCRTTHLSTFVLAAAPGVDVLMIVLISIGPIIVFATMVLTCCIVRRKRKQRQEREEKEAFLRVEGESYDRYRHSMFAIVRTAVDDGAKGVLILGMKSAIHEKPARWKLLQEDLYKAHLKKKAPFVDFGERLIDFSNIQFQQVTKEALSETLAHETAGRTFAIVAMCLEADTGYVEHDVRHHNKIKKDTQGTAKRILPFFHKAKQQRSKLAGLQVEMPKNTGVRAHTWFSFYRDTVLDIIMTCIDEGATGLTIFGIQPHIGGENTYLEWPALEEDVTHAYNHRLYPFDSTAVPDPTFKRVKPEDLRTRIKAETRRGAFVIIASCSDHHAPYAKQIIREFNASSGQCGKAMRAWATANDMYQTKGEQAAEQDHGHGHHSNQPSNQGPTATVPEEESFVVKEQPDGRSKCVEDRIALGEDGEVDKDTWNVLHDANEEDSDPDAFRI